VTTILSNLNLPPQIKSHVRFNNMAVSIGKRKRADHDDTQDDNSEAEFDVRARFQRAFEAKFKPLEPQSPVQDPEIDDDEYSDDEGSSDSEWRGIVDEVPAVQIFEHEADSLDLTNASVRHKDQFMVGTTLLYATFRSPSRSPLGHHHRRISNRQRLRQITVRMTTTQLKPQTSSMTWPYSGY
jgi:hypothetical protein